MKRLTLALLLLATSCGLASSEINEIGLIYEGGLVQDKSFQGILKPGATSNSVGAGSTVYRYRIDQRTFIAGEGPNDDVNPVQVVSEDDVRLAVEYQLYFKLNQDEEILREFHENLGVKTEAWTPGGWIEMLATYFAPQVERALETAALQQPWRNLYAEEAARTEFQNETVSRLQTNIRDVIGGDYFCGPAYTGPDSECGDFTFTIGKPTPVNTSIVEAVESEQTAVAAKVAQEQENQRIRKELEAERDLVRLYGPQGALLRAAIESGKVQLMVVPQKSDVSIPTRPSGP